MLDYSKPLHIPLAAGVDLRTHEFALDAPSLRICQNARFDKPGALTKRWGHDFLATSDAYTISDPEIDSGHTSSAASSFSTNNLAGLTSAGDLVLLWILQSDTAPDEPSGFIALCTFGPPHAFFQKAATVTFTNRRFSVYWAQLPSALSGTIDVSFPSVQDRVLWSVHHYANGRLGGSHTATGTGTSATVPIGFRHPSSLVAMGLAAAAISGNWTASAPATGLDTQTVVGSTNEVSMLFTEFSNTFDETPSATRAASVDWVGISVEVMPPLKGNDIGLGGSLLGIRGVAARGNELVAFASDDGINTSYSAKSNRAARRAWSWSEALEKWIAQGAYDGCKVTHEVVVDGPEEQYLADAARYTNGEGKSWDLVVWRFANGVFYKYAVIDVSTGTIIGGFLVAGENPRALAVGAKFHIYFTDGTALKVRTVDPLDPGTTTTRTVITSSTSSVPFDVKLKASSSQVFVAQRNAAGTGYDVKLINEDNSEAQTATHVLVAGATTPIALAYEPNNNRLLVVRVNATPAVRSDHLNGSTLAAITTDQAVDGTPGTVHQATAGWQETGTGGTYTCFMWFSATKTITDSQRVVRCYSTTSSGGAPAVVTTGPGGGTYFALHMDIASHAFARGKQVYLVLCHRPESDALGTGIEPITGYNRAIGSYTMWRNDGVMVADMLRTIGSRLELNGIEDKSRYLPQVQGLGSDVFRCLLVARKKLTTTPQAGTVLAYGDRTLHLFTFDFASKMPFRAVQAGEALYMPGFTYDGGVIGDVGGLSDNGAIESDFLCPPHAPLGLVTLGTTGGAVDSGLKDNTTYSYRAYWERTNARGEKLRSTYATTFQVKTGAGGGTANDTTIQLTKFLSFCNTMFRGGYERGSFALVLYRDDGTGTGFWRVTSPDPRATGNNAYIANDPTAEYLANWTDAMTDTVLKTKERDPTDSGEFDNVQLEPHTFLAAGQGRLFAGGFQDKDLVIFSKIRFPGEAIGFSEANEIRVPQEGGKVTGVAPLESSVVIFKENRIYRVDGIGPTNVGQGSYTEPQLVSADTGCVEGGPIIQTPKGLMFVSPKGIRITDGIQVGEIGAPVDDYGAGNTFAAALLIKDESVVLFIADGQITPLNGEDGISTLAYDYSTGQWSTWTKPIGPSVLWKDVYAYTDGTCVRIKGNTKLDAEVAYKMRIRTPWIDPAGSQGRVKALQAAVLGKYVAGHLLTVRTAFDRIAGFVQDKDWTVTPTKYQVRMGLTQRRFTAIQVEIEDEEDIPPLKDSAEIVALSLKVGLRPGLQKLSNSRSM